MDMRHIGLTNTNHPFHPIYWSCDTICVEKIEPPHQICPLHHAGTDKSTDKKPSENPKPKLDPAVEKMIDGMDVNIDALLRKQ